MHRIDHASRELDTHGSGKDGFTEGSPGIQAPTTMTADIANAFQEEIANAIELRGAGPLVKADNTQLAKAIAGGYGGICDAGGDLVIPDANFVKVAFAGGFPRDTLDIVISNVASENLSIMVAGVYEVHAHLYARPRLLSLTGPTYSATTLGTFNVAIFVNNVLSEVKIGLTVDTETLAPTSSLSGIVEVGAGQSIDLRVGGDVAGAQGLSITRGMLWARQIG